MAKKSTQKKKVKDLSTSIEFSDGKDHLREESKEAQSLESILGIQEKNPFGVTEASEFETLVSNMQLSELQALAVKAEVFPSGTKLTLKNKLIKAFSQYAAGSSKKIQVTKPIVDPNSKKGQDLMKLLKEQM